MMSTEPHPTSNLAVRVVQALAIGLMATTLFAQAPATDIGYVRISHEGELIEGSFVRVTDREAYDNQPSFLAEDVLLFTSMKLGAESEGTTAIVRYALSSEEHRTVVDTPQSEYSPTKMPSGSAISVVRDYGDQQQQLWSFELGETGPAREGQNLLPGINPIGYHAWVDARRLVLFVLGEPPTLQLAEVGPEPGKILAQNPGRALARIPGTQLMSFVHKVSDEAWWLCSIDLDDAHSKPKIERLLRMPAGREDYAWSPDGAVWTAENSELLRAAPSQARAWQKVADLTESGVHGITRLAFDSSGKTLALVFSR